MEKKFSDELFDLSKYIPGFCIDDSNRKALCFKEVLTISLKSDFTNDVKQIGQYCIQVEFDPQGRKFFVHMHSSMITDSYFSGTKLISSTTEELQCLEEKYIEFLYDKIGLHEKSLSINLEKNAYHLEIMRICPCNVSPLIESKDLKLCQYENLIGEGANLLLMRYLAIINFDGTLRLQNITINGEIIISDYICTVLQNIKLYDNHQEAYTIKRKIYKEDKLIQQIKIYLTLQGRILIYDWLDTPYMFVHKNLLMQDTNVNEQIPLRKWWMQDIEMLSKYLDIKSCNIVQYTDYITDHLEIKQLIADYVQTLLVVKPVDVIDFTIQYFKAFARESKVWNTIY